jgi:undecaprenyl pyrophosphate phosphatase UppP
MEKGVFSRSGFTIIAALWTSLTGTHAQNFSEQAILNRTLADLTNLTEHRRIRHLESRSGMPGVFWVLLMVGGAMVVVYTCLFDIEQMKLHMIHVVGTTFIIALVLVTIADVDAPYGGALHIQPTTFVLALGTMNGENLQQ